MSMRSDLGKARGLGSARDGTHHFWLQRVTAMANVPLVIFMLWFVISHLGADRTAIISTLKNPFSAVAMCLALVSMLWHMKLGLQMVIEDYVHGAPKYVALLLNTFYAFGLGALGLYAILKMSFGV
jgi:succinate dehydrogenase / fumarate reductase, membrane anchor subunit